MSGIFSPALDLLFGVEIDFWFGTIRQVSNVPGQCQRGQDACFFTGFSMGFCSRQVPASSSECNGIRTDAPQDARRGHHPVHPKGRESRETAFANRAASPYLLNRRIRALPPFGVPPSGGFGASLHLPRKRGTPNGWTRLLWGQCQDAASVGPATIGVMTFLPGMV